MKKLKLFKFVISLILIIDDVDAGCNPLHLFCDEDGNFDATFNADLIEGSIALYQYGMFYSKKETRSEYQFTELTCASQFPKSTLINQGMVKIGNTLNDHDDNVNS